MDKMKILAIGSNEYEVMDSKARPVHNISEMKTLDNLVPGDIIRTIGYHTANDGGGAIYMIREKDVADVEDNGLIHFINDTLVAELVTNDVINVKQFGAYANGETDDRFAFVNALATGTKKLYIPNGRYFVSAVIPVPETCSSIIGDSIKGTIINCNNDCFDFGTVTKNHLQLSSISFIGDNNNKVGTAIKGKFSFSKIENLRFAHFNKAIESIYGTWITLVENCDFSYCNYGWYHDTTLLNNVKFLNCYFQHMDTAFYCGGASKQINFSGCNIETSVCAFDVVVMDTFVVDNCYIEANDNILKMNGHYYDSDYIFRECFFYPKETEAINGWLCYARTTNDLDVRRSMLTIENCLIENKDTNIKPFAFDNSHDSSHTKCYLAISLINNNYNDMDINTYFDLFDLNNCPDYGNRNNCLPIVTDLPFYKNSNCEWYIKHKGKRNNHLAKNLIFHAFGNIEISSTGKTQLTIPLSKLVIKNPAVSNLTCTVRYTDATVEVKEAKIDIDNNLYVTKVDSAKEVQKVILDITY